MALTNPFRRKFWQRKYWTWEVVYGSTAYYACISPGSGWSVLSILYSNIVLFNANNLPNILFKKEYSAYDYIADFLRWYLGFGVVEAADECAEDSAKEDSHTATFKTAGEAGWSTHG